MDILGAIFIDIFVTKHRRNAAVLARNFDEQDRVDALTTRYVAGQLSEEVFKASLRKYLDLDDIRFLVMTNQLAHRNSLAFKRGDVS